MSPREETARKLADWINEHRLNNPFGGDVHRDGSGRFYSVLFAYPRYLDGLLRVYGPKFILIEARGPWARFGGNRVYDSIENAIAFLQAAFVDHDLEAAERVPIRKEKKRKPGRLASGITTQ